MRHARAWDQLIDTTGNLPLWKVVDRRTERHDGLVPAVHRYVDKSIARHARVAKRDLTLSV